MRSAAAVSAPAPEARRRRHRDRLDLTTLHPMPKRQHAWRSNIEDAMLQLWLWISSADGKMLIAGALGGAVNWMTRRASVIDGITQIFVGSICAVYLSPIAVPAITPVLGNLVATPEEIARLSGFAIGLGGVSVSGFFLDFWHRYREKRADPKAAE